MIQTKSPCTFKYLCTSCDFPNGCIVCTHLGGLLLLYVALYKYNEQIEEEEEDSCVETSTHIFFAINRNHFPVPVNDVLSWPMVVKFACLDNNSQRKQQQNKYRKKTRKNNWKNWRKNTKKQHASDVDNNESTAGTETIVGSSENNLASTLVTSLREYCAQNQVKLSSKYRNMFEYTLHDIINATDLIAGTTRKSLNFSK